jgi:hypothetical protein
LATRGLTKIIIIIFFYFCIFCFVYLIVEASGGLPLPLFSGDASGEDMVPPLVLFCVDDVGEDLVLFSGVASGEMM